MDYGIIITFNIGADFHLPTIIQCVYIKHLVELMVARDDKHLFILVRSPIPKRVPCKIVIANVANVTSQYKKISDNLYRMMFDVASIFGQFQMQIGSILYFSHTTKNFV